MEDRDQAFVGRCALVSLLVTLGLFGLGLVTGRQDMAWIVFMVGPVVSLVLGVIARDTLPGRISTVGAGLMLLMAIVSSVAWYCTSKKYDEIRPNNSLHETALPRRS